MQKPNSFLPYLNNLWVPIRKRPAPGDHESYMEISFLRLTNLIPFFMFYLAWMRPFAWNFKGCWIVPPLSIETTMSCVCFGSRHYLFLYKTIQIIWIVSFYNITFIAGFFIPLSTESLIFIQNSKIFKEMVSTIFSLSGKAIKYSC